MSQPAARFPVARVLPLLGLPQLDRPFDYLVTEGESDAAQPGVRVRIRFAGRLVDAIVLERTAASSHEGSLRFIERVISPEQVAPEQLRSLIDAYLTARGIKTLEVRMDRHCSNAQAVAEFLESRPEVKQVLYPGLPSHPGHDLAKKQMRGFGGMMSVRFHSEEHARQICLNTKLISLAESLGGVESLIEHPQNMTHISAEGSELVPPADLVRISVGIESIDDLLADLEQALDALD